ncbi:MAG: hypothetical protein QG594_868 [Bacteroidota bacterium]|nr:hypothetical protein [Bacteroidota bacterium]
MKKYKVINTYPDAKFEKDEILIQYFFDPPSKIDTENDIYCYTTNPDNPLAGGCIDKQYVENMPHLFQEINKAAELKIEGKQPVFHVGTVTNGDYLTSKP